MKKSAEGTFPEGMAVGLPRTLYYFTYPGLWEEFFRGLGLMPVTAEPATQQKVERAGLLSESEHCLPMKMFDAHVAELVDKVGTIFVPRVLSTLKGHISCPKLGALPDSARALPGLQDKVLCAEINEDKTPLPLMLEALGMRLGRNRTRVRNAASRAMEAMDREHSRLSVPSAAEGRRMLLLAHPYNLYDPFFSGPVVRKLQALRVSVAMVPFERKALPPDPIKWDACSQMHHALRRLEARSFGGVIQISSFNCGCDSIVGEFHREVLREKKIPFLTLILDEHSSPAGLETRLEAFVDSCGW